MLKTKIKKQKSRHTSSEEPLKENEEGPVTRKAPSRHVHCLLDEAECGARVTDHVRCPVDEAEGVARVTDHMALQLGGLLPLCICISLRWFSLSDNEV